jgi:3-methylcrotonyl-CoA carboxylase alpha subunit
VLVVLEAMKMELAVSAPHDGTVRTIACRVGELVQPGVPLLDIQ